MMIEGLDLRARGVLLTLLFLCDEEGCRFNQSSLARELGLSRQEIRTVLKNLVATNWITNLLTNSGTNSATNLTFNSTKICELLKTIKKPIQQPIRQPIETLPMQGTAKATRKPEVDWEAFMAYFNSKVKDTKIAQVRVMTEGRKRQIRSLLGKYSKQDLAKVVDICVATPFLRGENKNGWKADFDFIYTEKHFVKIMEGGYERETDNQVGVQSSGRSQGRGATLAGVAREILRGIENGGRQ